MPHPDRLTKVDEDRTPHFQEAASVVVVNHKNEVLLLQRVDYGNGFGLDWVFPGGGVEKGEKNISAARRELAEEAGISLEEDRNVLFPLTRYITAPDSLGVQHDLIIYISRYYPDQTEPTVASPSEILKWGWFNPNEVLWLVGNGEMKMLRSMVFAIQRVKDYLSDKKKHKYNEAFIAVEPDILQKNNKYLINVAFEYADYVYIGLKWNTKISFFNNNLHQLRKYLFLNNVLDRSVILPYEDFISQKSYDPKLDIIITDGSGWNCGEQINRARLEFKMPLLKIINPSNIDEPNSQRKTATKDGDYLRQFV